KRIAKAAIKAAQNLSAQDRGSIFVVLLPQEFKSSNYPAGEMDPRPAQDLGQRRREQSGCGPLQRRQRKRNVSATKAGECQLIRLVRISRASLRPSLRSALPVHCLRRVIPFSN